MVDNVFFLNYKRQHKHFFRNTLYFKINPEHYLLHIILKQIDAKVFRLFSFHFSNWIEFKIYTTYKHCPYDGLIVKKMKTFNVGK